MLRVRALRDERRLHVPLGDTSEEILHRARKVELCRTGHKSFVVYWYVHIIICIYKLEKITF